MDEQSKCIEDGCDGEYRTEEDEDKRKEWLDGECSCHIAPPCSFCMTMLRVCDKCGDVSVDDSD